MGEIDPTLLDSLRKVRREFLACLDPHRPELFRYCRRLTGDPWDAEDLVQETLARALARAAQTRQEIDRPLAWLVRIATNAYLDSVRRPAPVPLPPSVEVAAPERADPAEVRDALAEMTSLLPPQERVALVLKDVFDLPLAEIAGLLDTTVGAVKSALHRGRGRLAAPRPPHRPVADRAVLDELAAAFSAYDLERIVALLRTDATSEIVGIRHEVGTTAIRAGSLGHTLLAEDDVRYRAEIQDFDGYPILVLFSIPVDGSGAEALADVLRLTTVDGAIAGVRWYYFCPDTLTEVAERFGVSVRTHGYRL